ncbi:hypothetical protein [Spiroplasma endosymbiont of Danaus chrysippus]|uniref:hypothetical protein n=1 Tax=Spiroplasma endosymbiont of Danaus chrysippus TaxID=2691041 RepID=UPI00157B5766|nr:hypothetical protein [Spiroplasma endosymbiont of Danaus chrysippus]
MILQKYKKLKLLTLFLFILTILIMVIGLMLIGFSNFNKSFFEHLKLYKEKRLIIEITNGFSLLNYMSVNYILNHSPENICSSVVHNYDRYYDWVQLQIGVIFCIILTPIFGFFTIALTFLIIGLKVKIKNNNFWDAIQKCEIINSYYVH